MKKNKVKPGKRITVFFILDAYYNDIPLIDSVNNEIVKPRKFTADTTLKKLQKAGMRKNLCLVEIFRH